MAESTIGELPQIEHIETNDLLLVEQNGIAKKILGEQFTDFVNRLVFDVDVQYVDTVAEESSSFDDQTGLLTLKIKRGDTVTSIEDTTPGSVDPAIRPYTVYTITFSSGATSDFRVYNGRGIARIYVASGDQSIVDELNTGVTYTRLTVEYTDGATNRFLVRNGTDGDGAVTGIYMTDGVHPDQYPPYPRTAYTGNVYVNCERVGAFPGVYDSNDRWSGTLPLPISRGGTGAINAASARANLGLPDVDTWLANPFYVARYQISGPTDSNNVSIDFTGTSSSTTVLNPFTRSNYDFVDLLYVTIAGGIVPWVISFCNNTYCTIYTSSNWNFSYEITAHVLYKRKYPIT